MSEADDLGNHVQVGTTGWDDAPKWDLALDATPGPAGVQAAPADPPVAAPPADASEPQPSGAPAGG
jgi:hypothetical protein